MNWLQKLIPAYIEIRSLYWVRHEAKMELALVKIFEAIDKDECVKAEKLIQEFDSTFSQSGVPNWVGIKYAEIYRAKSMLAFLNG